jgi:DNA (cytosine-5)-methyltransferase 1
MTTVTSLFSGAGGLDIGFTNAGFDVQWANDTDPHAKVIHDAAMQRNYMSQRDSHFSTGNIMHANWEEEIPDSDVIIGGPPCQGFSRAGNQDPDDPRSQMIFAFSAVVYAKKPRAFLMENVKDLTSSRHASAFQRLKSFLRESYDLCALVVDAAEYGVPQHRERLFLAGFPKNSSISIPFTCAMFDQRMRGGTVRSVLSEMPVYGALGNDIKSNAKITFARNPVLRSSPYSGMLFNGARPLNLDAPAYTLPAIMGGNKTPFIDSLSLNSGGSVSPWVEWYHPFLVDGARPYRGDSGYVHRRITAQEAAALQTFPVDLPWNAVPASSAYRLIGNAVPPTLATCVAKALKHALDIEGGY